MATAWVRPLVPHLAPGDPVILVIRFSPEVGAVTRIDPLEVSLARPDGTTQRTHAAVDVTTDRSATVVLDLAAAGRLDLALAGQYRLSLAGVAHGAGAHRFASREMELEVMGDGRLPLAEIERRARGELARRHPRAAPDSAVVVEGPAGDRAVRFSVGGAIYFVRLTPAGAIRGVDAPESDDADWLLFWGGPPP